MALGKLDIIIAADTAQIRKDMNTAIGIMQSGTKVMENVAKTAAATLGGYFAFDMFKAQIQQTLDFADNLSKLSQKTGISTDALYSLNAAAKLSDVEFESLSGSLSKFNKNIGAASEGSGDAKKAFDSLGISVKNQDGTLKNSFEILGELADQFKDMPDGATKASTAMALFGKSGAELIPLLNSGRDSLREYLGVMNDETGKAAEAFNDSFTKIGISIESLKLKALQDFTPSMQSITVDIENVAKSMQEFSSNGSVNYYETFKEYAKDFTALGVAIYGTPALLKATSFSIDAVSNSAVISASKMALFGNELERSIAKTVLLKNSTILLSTAFKSFAPTAALFAITEVFLNWDKITGKVYDNLEKISNFKLQEMIDKQAEYVKTLEDRKSKNEDSNGFLAFLGASWSTMDDNTLRFAKQDLLVLQNQIAKNKEKINSEEKKNKKDTGLSDETSAIKIFNSTLSAQIQGLEKQFDIKKQIEALNIESALRNEAISKPEAERLKEINDITSQIAKNQETINLLKTKKYESGSTDQAADLQKMSDLQKEEELLILKKVAAEERYKATVKSVNEELMISIGAINMSDVDKKYQDLSKSVQDLINKGADLKLVGEYATKLADQIERDGAYTHLQTELDIRSQIAEVSLYGAQKETALEQIRHDGVIANLSRELETKKLNADEYLKLLEIENQRHAQNSDSFYKFMLDAFNNIEKAMDENFFNAMTGKFKSFGDWLKDLFKNIGTSIAQGLSRTIAGNITQSLEGGIVNMYRSYGGFGTSSSLVGSTLSASDLSSLASSAGSTVADGKITTAGGTVIDQASGTVTSQGSDALSLLNTASSLKTAYGLITDGISGSIISGFNGAANLIGNFGFSGLGGTISNFGAGFASPLSFATQSPLAGLYGSGVASEIPMATMAGGVLSSGLLGYGMGSLGDAIFGANTKAGTLGAVGAAIGSIVPGIGTILGGVIGSILGGLFGSTKMTGQRTGIDIFGNVTADNASGRYFSETDYKKKSWFSSKSWTDYAYQGFSNQEIEAIKSTIGVYDYLLAQLGEYNDLVVSGGRFSNLQSFLDTNVVKAFLVSINPSNLDTIYQSWTDYAAEIDKTITEALATAVSGYTTYKRGYTEWFLGSGTVEQLAFTSNYLQKDFEALASSLGASSVTVDNFLSMYDAAIKNNFTQDTIEAWASLGDALMKSTDATKKYKDALDSLNGNTTYSFPVDTMLTKVNNTSQQIDIKQLVTTQTGQNDTVINLLVQSVKTLQSILKEAQFGKAIV